MEVSWLPLTLTEARGFVSSYTVAYDSELTSISVRLSAMYTHVPANQTTVVIDRLNPGLTYYVKVWANTSAGAGMASEAILAETLMTGSYYDDYYIILN